MTNHADLTTETARLLAAEELLSKHLPRMQQGERLRTGGFLRIGRPGR